MFKVKKCGNKHLNQKDVNWYGKNKTEAKWREFLFLTQTWGEVRVELVLPYLQFRQRDRDVIYGTEFLND